MNNIVPQILHHPTYGYYCSGLRPFVSSIKVSQDETNVFSLEWETSFDPSRIIGTFTGFCGDFINDDELVIGFNFSYGIIYVGYVKTYTISNGNISPFVPVENNLIENNLIENNPIEEHENQPICLDNSTRLPNPNPLPISTIKASCTTELKYIDSNLNLSFESEFNPNLICGIFYGSPGDCYSNPNSIGYDRVYGKQHAGGTITLNRISDVNIFNYYSNANKNPYEFEYILADGVVQERSLSYYFSAYSFDDLI